MLLWPIAPAGAPAEPAAAPLLDAPQVEPSLAEPLDATRLDEITLVFTGDNLLGARMPRLIEQHGEKWPYGAVAGVLSFAAMKPWSVGGTAFTAHWPVFGYVPLLILLGLALAGTARWIGAAVIGSGLAIVAALLGFLALSTVYDRLPVSMRGLATAKLSGWDRLATAVEALAAQEPDAAATVVTDRVTTLTYVAFGLGRSRGVYTIDDRPLGEVRGRAKQVAIWRLNEAGLRADRAGQDAIVVIETRRLADDTGRLCTIFAQVEPRDRVRRAGDGRSFDILLGRSIRAEPGQGTAPGRPGLCGPA